MISQKNADSNAIKVIIAEASAPIGLPKILGIKRKNHKMTITRGIDRIMLTYIDAGISKNDFPERRINANKVPKKIPPAVAMTVN